MQTRAGQHGVSRVVAEALRIVHQDSLRAICIRMTPVRIVDMQEILLHIDQSRTPIHLTFELCSIEQDAFLMLMNSKDARRSVRSLSMLDCLDYEWPWEGLKHMHSLDYLLMRMNTRGRTSFACGLRDLLGSEECQLKHLTLQSLDQQTMNDSIAGLDIGIRTRHRRAPCKLEYLSLRTSSRHISGMRSLADALRECKALKHLDIDNVGSNDCMGSGFHFILQSIPRYLRLEVFSMDAIDDHMLTAVLTDLRSYMLTVSTLPIDVDVHARAEKAYRYGQPAHMQVRAEAILYAIRGHPSLQRIGITVRHQAVGGLSAVNAYMNTARSPRSRILVALVSAYDVPRLGAGSAFRRIVPKDVVRRLGGMLEFR